MSAAQCKAVRRKMKHDPRYQPKKGLRAGINRAQSRNRKRIAAGKNAGSIGYVHKG